MHKVTQNSSHAEFESEAQSVTYPGGSCTCDEITWDQFNQISLAHATPGIPTVFTDYK